MRAQLELDSGYVSRLLRSLERQGLVQAEAGPKDGRVRRITLTREGMTEVAEMGRRSDVFATSVLAPLGAVQRARLVTAMGEIERLMSASAVQIKREASDSSTARWCLEEYFWELARRFDAGFDPAQSISANAEELTPPAGIFDVARLGSRPIGCGATQGQGPRYRRNQTDVGARRDAGARHWSAHSPRARSQGTRVWPLTVAT